MLIYNQVTHLITLMLPSQEFKERKLLISTGLVINFFLLAENYKLELIYGSQLLLLYSLTY